MTARKKNFSREEIIKVLEAERSESIVPTGLEDANFKAGTKYGLTLAIGLLMGVWSESDLTAERALMLLRK